MNIAFKSSSQDITGGTRALLEEKFMPLERLLADPTSEPILECEIEQSVAVERAGAKYRVEGNLSVDGRFYRAEATGVTLEATVDSVRDELLRELKRARGRERNLVRRGGAALKRMLRLG